MNSDPNLYLSKHLKDFGDDHPLLIIFDLNPDFMTYFEALLKDLDAMPNLSSKIKQLKDPSNWESVVSELEFAEEIRGLNPEFVLPKGSTPSTDLRIDLFGEKLFFEVKLLAETDEASRVYRNIWAIESDFLVQIVYEILDRDKADKLIDFVRDKIMSQQTGSFRVDGNEVEIQRKRVLKSPRTSLIMRSKEALEIPFEPLRRKIFMDFYDKLPQFLSERFVFWVIDAKRWKHNYEDFKTVVYGSTVADLTVGLRHYLGFEEIYRTHMKNPELFYKTDIVPTFTYPRKDGLFFLKDAECLNGIVIRSHGQTRFLLNPFADPQLDIAIIRKLRDLFPPA